MIDGIGFDHPTGRKLDTVQGDPRAIGTVRVLPRADKELVKELSRRLDEIDAKHLEQRDGKTWVDKRSGEEFELVRHLVDPTDPAASAVSAFTVSDDNVLYWRPVDAVLPGSKTVVVGTFAGRRA